MPRSLPALPGAGPDLPAQSPARGVLGAPPLLHGRLGPLLSRREPDPASGGGGAGPRHCRAALLPGPAVPVQPPWDRAALCAAPADFAPKRGTSPAQGPGWSGVGLLRTDSPPSSKRHRSCVWALSAPAAMSAGL